MEGGNKSIPPPDCNCRSNYIHAGWKELHTDSERTRNLEGQEPASGFFVHCYLGLNPF